MTEDELQEAVALLAYIVLRHGAVYAPLLERAEKELIAFRQRHDDPMVRAERLLRAYTREGGLSMIR
jgi:hypothetical protein